MLPVKITCEMKIKSLVKPTWIRSLPRGFPISCALNRLNSKNTTAAADTYLGIHQRTEDDAYHIPSLLYTNTDNGDTPILRTSQTTNGGQIEVLDFDIRYKVWFTIHNHARQ